MPAKRALRAVKPAPDHPATPDLRDAVRASLAAMPWLGESDRAVRALAEKTAAEIEKAVERAAEFDALRRDLAGDESAYKRLQKLEAQCDVTKAVGWLGQQLQGYMRDLGGTPGTRRALQPDKAVGGRLAQLRAASAGKHDT